MAQSKPIGRFKSTADARKNAQRILSSVDNYQIISGLDAEDITDILNNHPDKLEIIGCGVKHIFKEPNDYGKAGFAVERMDHTKRSFSLEIALAGKYPSLEEQRMKALDNELFIDCKRLGKQRVRASRQLKLVFMAAEEGADWEIENAGIGPTLLVNRDLARRWTDYYWAHA